MKRISAKRLAALGGRRPSSTLARRGRIKARNAKRQAKNFERAYGGKVYRAYVVSLPCAVCCIEGFTDPAHAKGDGGSRKANARYLLPLCGLHPNERGELVEGCHNEAHRIGVQSFEAAHAVSLLDLADATWRRWQASLSQQDPKNV